MVDLVRNAWRWKCYLPESDYRKDNPTIKNESKQMSYDEIKESQWNPLFEKLRLNRMVLGFFRYGLITGNKNKYANVDSAILRLQKYQETGNSEFLVDAANLCMIEFTQENHPKFHFDSIDDGIHTKQIK